MLELYFTKTLFLTGVVSCLSARHKKHLTGNKLRRADVTRQNQPLE